MFSQITRSLTLFRRDWDQVGNSVTCYDEAETKEGASVTKHRPTRGDVALVQVTMEKGWLKTGILFCRLP